MEAYRKKNKENGRRKRDMWVKKWRWIVPGCTALIAALFLCIPAMAGGYSVCSELKVNIIGIASCLKDEAWIEESFMNIPPEEKISTPSNASKSDAIKGSKSLEELDSFPIKKEAILATLSNGNRKINENVSEKVSIEKINRRKASDSNAESSENYRKKFIK